MRSWISFRLEPESERLLHLDALRLIAAAAIVFIHLVDKVEAPGWDAVLTMTRPAVLFVDLFFVISGYVIAFVYLDRVTELRGYGRFMQKRLARLAPLHWAMLACLLALGLGAGLLHVPIAHADFFDLRCLPANLLFLHATGLCPHRSFNGPSWSISAEMFMYLISPAIFWLLRRSPAGLLCAAAAIWGLLTALSLHGTPWPHWADQGGVLRAIPSFMFGAWLFAIREKLPHSPWAAAAMWASLIAFMAGCYFGLSVLLLMLILYAAVAFAAMADQGHAASRSVRLLAAGGQLTYSSYMIHMLVVILMLTIGAEHLLHLHGAWKNLAVLVTFLAVWPLSYLSLVAFERPLRSRIAAIGAKPGFKEGAAPSDQTSRVRE